MKLYEVTNGYTGYDTVMCQVIAPDETRAIELARERFKAAAKDYGQGEPFYSNLKAQVVCQDTTKEYTSEVNGWDNMYW